MQRVVVAIDQQNRVYRLIDPSPSRIMRVSMSSDRVAPHACLREGRIASIVRGPLAGRSGIIAPSEELQIVLNIDAIDGAIAVFMNSEDLE